jgi:hypothetical protein
MLVLHVRSVGAALRARCGARAAAAGSATMLSVGTEHKRERDKWFNAHIFAANRVEPLRRCAFGGKSMIITRLSRDSAKQDPGGTFESPLRVVDEIMFTRGEKIATLDKWRRVILQELVAAGEVDRARLLGEIEEARHRLIR